MLPPFIIEQIRQREQSEADARLRREAERPRLELPLDMPDWRPREPQAPPSAPERGYVVLDV